MNPPHPNKTKERKNKNKNKKPALLKEKKKKKRAENVKRGGGSFVQIFFSLFTPIFPPNLERLYFKWGGEKTCGPHHFSLPLPLSTKHHSHSFSLLFSTFFFFFFIHPKIYPTKHTLTFQKSSIR